MKNILFLVFLVFTVSSFGQNYVNVDSIAKSTAKAEAICYPCYIGMNIYDVIEKIADYDWECCFYKKNLSRIYFYNQKLDRVVLFFNKDLNCYKVVLYQTILEQKNSWWQKYVSIPDNLVKVKNLEYCVKLYYSDGTPCIEYYCTEQKTK